MLDRFFKFLEKDRFYYPFIYLVVGIYAEIRGLFEARIFHPANMNIPLMLRYDAIAYFWLAFLAGTTIVSIIASIPLKNISNLFLYGFWLIIMPPVFDEYIFHHPSYYHYTGSLHFFHNLIFFYSKTGITPGIKLEVAIILLLVFIYSFVRTKNLFKSLLAVILIYVLSVALKSTDTLKPFLWLAAHFSNERGKLFLAVVFNLAMLFVLPFTEDGRELIAESIRSISLLPILNVFIGLSGVFIYDVITKRDISIRPLDMFVFGIFTVSMISNLKHNKKLLYTYLFISIWFILSSSLLSAILLTAMLILSLIVKKMPGYISIIFALLTGLFSV
ncbi:MAG: hypothetical protein M1381_07670 [Deltaproteobacteria bacterium]|nr:hypothetical protein [Deltaproteobacteria bacterium]MCL5792623.1 hypothetical protein [Deltaproteobacteria bacterium]